MNDRLAHSAEHAFIGSLQKILGRTLQVRKVEHNQRSNRAFIVDKEIPYKAVQDAESDVNSLIARGAKIIERQFASLEDARKDIPTLRANEKRISGQVRVVEIEGHDQAACIMDHASNLGECGFFLVTGFSKSGQEYEVEFMVSNDAKTEALRFASILFGICSELGANINTVENSVKKLRNTNELNLSKLRSITEEEVAVKSKKESRGNIALRWGVFANLDDETILEYTGRLLQSEATIVLFINTSRQTSRFVLARTESLAQLDLRLILQGCPGNPRGGGKPHFVTGVVDSSAAEPFLESVLFQARKDLPKVR